MARIPETYISALSLLLVSVLVSTAASSAQDQIPRPGCAAENDYGVTEIALPPSPWPRERVLVRNGVILWQEIVRDGKFAKVIRGYNFETGENLSIGPDTGASLLGGIAHDTVVYAHTEQYSMKYPSPIDIRTYDLNTGREETVATSSSGPVRVSDSNVVWADPLRGIFAYDLRERKTRQLTTGVQYFLQDVSGDLVVFRKGGDLTIFAYDLPTGKEFPIVRPTKLVSSLISVYGNLLVWDDAREGDSDIFAFDLKSRKESPLVVAPGNQSSPVVGSEIVVYGERLRFDPPADIFGYDIRAKTEFVIASSRNTSWTDKSVWRNVVAWVERRPRVVDDGDIQVVSVSLPPQWQLPHGCFFTQTGGLPDGDRSMGYSVVNDSNAQFWDEFRIVGGVDVVGYPMSRRFVWDGFATQVFQRSVFQWRPGEPGFYFINVFDELSRKGLDDWLLALRSTPKPLPPDFDAGKNRDEIARDRLALLDENPAIKDKYWEAPGGIHPRLLYGIPTSRVTDMGNHWAIRSQRAVIQQWKEDVPWARAGQVTVANGGEIAAEAGLIPKDVLQPEAPPIS